MLTAGMGRDLENQAEFSAKQLIVHQIDGHGQY